MKVNRALFNQIYKLIIERNIDLYINLNYNLATLSIKTLKLINHNNIEINYCNQINAQAKIQNLRFFFNLNLRDFNYRIYKQI